MSGLSLFTHTYKDNHTPQTLFLLHGTGGTEHDFLFLDDLLGHTYNLVGLRGNIREGTANRFFRRLEEGVFDVENMKEEAGKLTEFIRAWKKHHTGHYTFLGYSNGANILLATLFLHPASIRTAVLLHPMMPFDVPQPTPELSGLTISVSYGLHDPLVAAAESRRVIDALSSCGAGVHASSYAAGHGITEGEIQDVVAFLVKSAEKE